MVEESRLKAVIKPNKWHKSSTEVSMFSLMYVDWKRFLPLSTELHSNIEDFPENRNKSAT